MEKPLLNISDLEISFRTENGIITAVKNIYFHLNPKETLGIVGESGSGKSVTALSIMRLIAKPGKISNGHITFNENDVSQDLLEIPEKDMRKYRANKIAMIFQEPMTSLNPVYPCGRQITEAIILHKKVSKKEAYQQTIALFNEVKLPRPEQIFTSYPHQLSGGQKQRVMIAMALSCNPDILIADEPTTALDVTVQKTILELLKSLQKKHGMAIIFITHDLAVVAEIADRVLVMYQGNIVEEGTVKDIFLKPLHSYTKGLIACRPSLDKNLKRLPTVEDFMNSNSKQTVEEFVNSIQIQQKEEVPKEKNKILLSTKELCTWFPEKKALFSKTQKWVKAVDDITLDIFESETLGLVGESGCGKTTLGRTLLKLIEPTSGTIQFKGENIDRLKESHFRKFRKDMQIIFQDPYSSLNPRKTVGAAIFEPMQVHKLHSNAKARKEKTIELLEKVSLSADYFSRYPHELSGGQRQRVCIARALSLEPKFIICDESVSALDVSVQAHVLNLLQDLKKEFNLTYIFISHDLSVVNFMSDRMAVMQNGRIVELGEAEQVYNKPKNDYTIKLINAIPKGI